MPKSDLEKAQIIIDEFHRGNGQVAGQFATKFIAHCANRFGDNFSLKEMARGLQSLSDLALFLKEDCETAASG